MTVLNKISAGAKRIVWRNAIRAFRALDAQTQALVIEDLIQTNRYDPTHVEKSLETRLVHDPSFRSIVAYRIKKSGNAKAWHYFRRFTAVYPQPSGIEIGGEIEGGLRIIHNACIVGVAHAGKNLSVGPFAVIGAHHNETPIIGDNVTICANAIVIGGVHIGDNALIGAGAFVDKDVEANTIVVGNPAKILRRRNKQCASNETSEAH